MAKNEPNKPDDGKTMPANETPTEQAAPVSEPLAADKQAEAPEVATDKAATLPGPGDDVVVSFDKINEIISEKKAAKAQEAEQPAPDKKEQEAPDPEKKTGRKGRPPKADKADKPDKEPKPEKAPKPEKSAKAPKSAGKQAPAKEEAPAPEPPPEPREAPRSGEQEQVVYLNLSELYPFKDHPFEVKNDDEMRAMVESVKDKGVTQAAIVRPREDAEPFYRNR